MNKRGCGWWWALGLVLGAVAPAQKVALGGDHGDQIVQVLDCTRLGADVSIEGLARIVQALGEPGLAAANVQPLGGTHIAVLGTPQQCAGAERLFALAIEHHGAQLYVDCKTLRIDRALFVQHVQPLLVAKGPVAPAAAESGPSSVVLAEHAAHDVLRAMNRSKACEIVQAPKVITGLLQEVRLYVGRERSYVADHRVGPAPDLDGKVGIWPIQQKIFQGSRTTVVATRRGDAESLVRLRADHDRYPDQLPTTEVTLANGEKAVVEVPHGQCCSIDVCAAIPDGQVLLAIAPVRDGTFMCWMLMVHVSVPAR